MGPACLIDSRTRNGQSGSVVAYYSREGFDGHYRDGFAVFGTSIFK